MKKLFVGSLCFLTCIAAIALFGLTGALFEHLGAWMYGWEPCGAGYVVGLFLGFALVPPIVLVD